MVFDWWTLALQAVNLAILVWLLHRFLYRPVLRVVDARRAEIDGQYAATARAKAEAEALRAEVETERAAIPADRAAALKAATAEAEQAATERLEQAERQAADMLRAGRSTLAEERARAETELRSMAVELGAEIAGRLLADIPAEHRAAIWMHRIESHLAELTEVQRTELVAGTGEGTDGGTRVCVVTDSALPEPVQGDWRARLQAALGTTFAVEFETDDALLAGAELHFPNTVLRFSWRSALAAIRSELAADEHAG